MCILLFQVIFKKSIVCCVSAATGAGFPENMFNPDNEGWWFHAGTKDFGKAWL